MSDSERLQYSLTVRSEGVSITEWEVYSDDDWVVSEEWWATWAELFFEITGVDEYAPDIHRENGHPRGEGEDSSQ